MKATKFTIERWVDTRIELVLDGTVIVDARRIGIVAHPGAARSPYVAVDASGVEMHLLSPASASRPGAATALAVLLGKRRVDDAAYRLPDELGGHVIFEIHAFDECWIDGRMMKPRSTSAASRS